MGRHNGKSRSTGGGKVGKALVKNNKGSKYSLSGSDKYREYEDQGLSILDRNSIDEIVAMAELANTKYNADVGIQGPQVVTPLLELENHYNRVALQEKYQHILKIPRRPKWANTMNPGELDAQERASFLEWRRQFARLEEDGGFIMTPFEKNLEIWRQLWRVLERSDVIVQVIDARDPLLYFSQDLLDYALEIDKSKKTLLLLNKADLLDDGARTQWSEYFQRKKLPYVFWSAYQAEIQNKAQQHQLRAQQEILNAFGSDVDEVQDNEDDEIVSKDLLKQDGAKYQDGFQQKNISQQQNGAISQDGVQDDVINSTDNHQIQGSEQHQQMSKFDAKQGQWGLQDKIKILDTDELLTYLYQFAQSVQDDAGDSRSCMVGLVGYPNVGKSSTINALYRKKKTAVAATPGKTKHFQTLIIDDKMSLCDCPGMVMPKFAHSKSQLATAGIIPIDRLVDVLGPCQTILEQVPIKKLEEVYKVKLRNSSHNNSTFYLDGVQLHKKYTKTSKFLESLALQRQWLIGGALADIHRTGRIVLKDFTEGKISFYKTPPVEKGNKDEQEREQINLESKREKGGSDRQEGVEVKDLPSEEQEVERGRNKFEGLDIVDEEGSMGDADSGSIHSSDNEQAEDVERENVPGETHGQQNGLIHCQLSAQTVENPEEEDNQGINNINNSKTSNVINNNSNSSNNNHNNKYTTTTTTTTTTTINNNNNISNFNNINKEKINYNNISYYKNGSSSSITHLMQQQLLQPQIQSQDYKTQSQYQYAQVLDNISELDEADLELMGQIQDQQNPDRQKKPEYKLKKKIIRVKGTRGRNFN